VHATATWPLYRSAPDRAGAAEYLEELFPKLKRWHAYLYRERDAEGDGLIYLRHPWESGQDNSPIWDRVLERIQPGPGDVPAYQRVDTALLNASERPSGADYDRYAYLVKLAYDHGYEEGRIRAVSPFLVQDVLFNSLLVQANRDLAQIARVVGEDPNPFEAWAERTAASLNAELWDEEHGIYFDRDLLTGERIHAHVGAGFSPLFAGVPTPRQAERILEMLNSNAFCRLNDLCWAVPSYDREQPGYAPDRYWRGPIWININWILYHGLRRYGFEEYAGWVKRAICELPSRGGFHEYFDSETGAGRGSDRFSWTAALVLDLLLEEPEMGMTVPQGRRAPGGEA
jgi:hypothetical protein